MAEAIQYDSSFFEKVLSYPIYKTKNVVAVNKSLDGLGSEVIIWKREGEDVEENNNQIERIGTNFWAMTIILNRLNQILLFANKKGISNVKTEDGETSTVQLDFMTNHVGNKEGFEKEFDRFHLLLDYFKEYILLPGSTTFIEILSVLSMSIPVGQEDNIFLKAINQFFPHSIDIKAEQSFGDMAAMDVEFNYRGNLFKAKVVSAKEVQRDGEFYKVWADVHPNLAEGFDYFVFCLPNNYVYVFEMDKTKFRDLSGDTLHNQTSQKGLSYLFHTDTLVKYKKLF